jgi:hypothetical protein
MYAGSRIDPEHDPLAARIGCVWFVFLGLSRIAIRAP